MFSYQPQVQTYVLEKYHLLGWQTVTGLGHRLLLWDESLLAFYWVTGTICPSSWGEAGWSEWSPGMLFSFFFGIPDLAAVMVRCGGWFGITCLVPCSAVNPGHNLLWLTLYCRRHVLLQSRWFQNECFLLVRHIGPGVDCFSHPSVFRALIFYSTHNKNLEGNSVKIPMDQNSGHPSSVSLVSLFAFIRWVVCSCPFSLGFDPFNMDWNSQSWAHKSHID